MPNDRPRVVLEKSRTVRRRYQRSNQRFQFTASQIARIEREEERERRAQKLRDKEKRRVVEKKKRVEKEAKAREERIRLGLPDPHAPAVSASQPLLFNFIKRPPSASPSVGADVNGSGNEETTGDGAGVETEPDTPLTMSTEVATDLEEELALDDPELEEVMVAAIGLEGGIVGSTVGGVPVGGDRGDKQGIGDGDDEDDEFSDCSIFYDTGIEEVLKETEASVLVGNETAMPTTTAAPVIVPTTTSTTTLTTEAGGENLLQEPNRWASRKSPPPELFGGDSFQDDTAALLDEFDPDVEWERNLPDLSGIY